MEKGAALTPDKFNLKLVGLEETKLKPEQKKKFKDLVILEAQKLQREIDSFFDVILHVKEYDKESKKQRYSLILKIEYPGTVLTSERGQKDTWNIESAVRNAFLTVENELIKRKRV